MLSVRKIFIWFLISAFHYSYQHAAMGLCLHPMTRASQIRLQALQQHRRGGSQRIVGLLECKSGTNHHHHHLYPWSSLGGDAALLGPPPQNEVLSKFLQRAIVTLPAWLVISPQFYYLFQERKQHVNAADLPYGPRWAIANAATDLSGTWIPIITSEFQTAFDAFASTCCDLSFLRRKLVVQFLGKTSEIIHQTQRGRHLEIVSANPVGQWNRTLVASGTTSTDQTNSTTTTTSTSSRFFFQPILQTVQDPEGNSVHMEAWWEDAGTVHRSWLRGKVDGVFESSRYLESPNVMVCESTFHPSSSGHSQRQKEKVSVVWRYNRADV
jgi:hypothetical protein